MCLLNAVDWFTNEKSLAAATWGLVAATALLVTVTVFLVIDGWRKSREQSKRWEHEDERRAEESKPSAVIELATNDANFSQMYFACFNLGSNTFFVDKLIVTITTNGARFEHDIEALIVTPGTCVPIPYEPSQLLGFFGESTPYKEANGVLVLKGATATVTTEPVWFHVGYGSEGRRCVWFMGRFAEHEPSLVTNIPKVLSAKWLNVHS